MVGTSVETDQVKGLAKERVVPASLIPARLSVGVVLDKYARWHEPLLSGQVVHENLGSDLLDGICHRWTGVVVEFGEDDHRQLRGGIGARRKSLRGTDLRHCSNRGNMLLISQ